MDAMLPEQRWPLLLCLLLLLLDSRLNTAQTVRAASVRQADAVCGQCHAKILESYLKTPMANASGLAAEHLLPGSYQQASAGVDYSVGMEDGRALLRYKLPTTPAITGKEELQYFLGSGHLGLTYLYEKNGYWLESPVAYYEKLRGYAMAPGLERAREMPAALPLNPSCLRCHMSGVERQVPGTNNLYRQLPFLQVGITCESCHGDARAHVAANGLAPVVNPIELTPERRDSTCIVCHLEGDTNVERRGYAALNFRPGEDVRKYMAYFAYASANTTKRAVSEIEQFNSSRCKLASGPGMSCMNCHDPHVSPTNTERVAFYRTRCLACHTQQKFVTDHFPAKPDCTGCHMPKTGSENIAHVAWTDHRLRRRPDEAVLTLSSLETKGEEIPELVPILSGGTSERDLALGYYDLAVKGTGAARGTAFKRLLAAATADPADLPVLQALGVVAGIKGDAGQSAAYYRAVLKLEPQNLTAGTNLGTLLARSGDLEKAASLLGGVFTTNEDVPELGRNLAIVECELGRAQDARRTLAKVLTYSPGLLADRQLLSDIEDGRRSCVLQTPAAGGSASP